MKTQIVSMCYSEWKEECNKQDVLPFYITSFERLNAGQEYICGYGYNGEVRKRICSALTSVCKNVIPNYYYDLRNWDDFSCAAPQYMILDSMNWQKTKPLAFLIKDKTELNLVLEQFSICAHENETAAIAIVEKHKDKVAVFSMLIVK